AHIPILLLTDAAEADQAKAEAVGSDGVLGKPLDPHVVISRVKELIAKPRRVPAPVAPSPAPPAQPPPPPVHPAAPPASPVRPPEPAELKTRAVSVAKPVEAGRPIVTAHAPPIDWKAAATPQRAVEAPAKPAAPPKPTLPPPLAEVFAALVAATPHEPTVPSTTDPQVLRVPYPAIEPAVQGARRECVACGCVRADAGSGRGECSGDGPSARVRLGVPPHLGTRHLGTSHPRTLAPLAPLAPSHPVSGA